MRIEHQFAPLVLAPGLNTCLAKVQCKSPGEYWVSAPVSTWCFNHPGVQHRVKIEAR